MKKRSRIWIPKDRHITPEEFYLDRRAMLRGMVALGLLPVACLAQDKVPAKQGAQLFRAPKGTYPCPRNKRYKVERPFTPEKKATSYNNFYEFSLQKTGVLAQIKRFNTQPWRVEIAGLCEKQGTVDLEDLFRHLKSEERAYRFRCVEAWAMTVPWSGFPMSRFLSWVKPQSQARYLRMVTFMKPKEAPNQVEKASSYEFPYYEAMTLAEAANELTFLAHGMYGKELPPQNGAPLRLVVPWKYGLKSIKSIVKFEFTAKRPPTFWNDLQPKEYSWHSNVEPEVAHPRWSQKTERLIDDGSRVKTQLYNGYADQVAGLYDHKKAKRRRKRKLK